MASKLTSKIALLAAVAALTACANPALQPMSPTPAEPESTAANVPESQFESASESGSRFAAASGAHTAGCHRQSQSTSIDTYKLGVARHILQSNLGHTFDGQLPPMLPAIVVLRLSVDNAGTLTNVLVQRSRDTAASEVAMASIRRSGALPMPCGLIYHANGTLTFSETFLFNQHYQFQLRSLANPQ